ncbi:sensor histidine kinase [Cohnella silvisoli]|uniref:histidine kinase n=1 Tax=Cohnella silvisoli TaxID=2873699 RepID=A0ABV1KP30_9BACL|nr:HAMP domain-containing sensor histidine kinase [Cohnella silvisoli]MCD9020935.1 HAMP domain-containing histidine kinase [Cohnella silvisoli]
MKTVRLLTMIQFLAVLISLFVTDSGQAYAADADADDIIRKWQVQWIGKDVRADESPRTNTNGHWDKASVDHPVTEVPSGAQGMWVRFSVPSTAAWQQPGMLVERLFGHKLYVYKGNQLIYQSERDFVFDSNKLLIPLGKYTEDTDFYIRIVTLSERAGLISGIQIGDFEQLSNRFVRKDLPDMLLGTSIAFLALIMLICSGYLNRKQRSIWVSLCLIALTTGTLIVAYSPLTYIYFKEYGNVILLLFDVSLFVLFPSLSYYIDQVFEGQYSFFSKFRRLQLYYSGFCFAVLITYKFTGERYYDLYVLFTNMILGFIILLQLLLIIYISIRNAMKGSKVAIILSLGISGLALSGVTDLTIYYLNAKRYELFLWKFGVIGMIMALVIILARRISADHAMLLTYSKELELYNHKLERTEKLKIISDLAASVAHEVRNPLQVTRGFLQLLAHKAEEQNKSYFGMAINELDRASAIITDFLTFAKPEMEEVMLLDLNEEMRKIEAMMTPLATMKGGTLQISIHEKLPILGNASKFKQAFINIIKNSIEAIDGDGAGLIEISAYSDNRMAVIHIKDNGEGMEDEEISKLGVPYFSTKTKGTGLGLMVTFRIIDVMHGTIEFHSVKGKGTEAIIRFPLVDLIA